MLLKVAKEDLVVVREEATAAVKEKAMVVAKEKAMAVVREEVLVEAEDAKVEMLVAAVSEISLVNHVKVAAPEEEKEAAKEDADLNSDILKKDRLIRSFFCPK